MTYKKTGGLRMKGFVLKVGKFVTVMSAMLFFMFGCFDKGSDEKNNRWCNCERDN